MQPWDLVISKELWTRALQWHRSDVIWIVAFTILNYAVMYSLCNEWMNFNVLWDSLMTYDRGRVPSTMNRDRHYYFIRLYSITKPSKIIWKLTT